MDNNEKPSTVLKKITDFIQLIIFFAICIALFWSSITTAIFSFKNPSQTRTQQFLHIPKSFLLNFKTKD